MTHACQYCQETKYFTIHDTKSINMYLLKNTANY